MAQDFERNTANGVGTSAVTLRTANSDDAIVGIMVANVTSSQITVEVYINDSSNDIHLIKDAPIPAAIKDAVKENNGADLEKESVVNTPANDSPVEEKVKDDES